MFRRDGNRPFVSHDILKNLAFEAGIIVFRIISSGGEPPREFPVAKSRDNGDARGAPYPLDRALAAKTLARCPTVFSRDAIRLSRLNASTFLENRRSSGSQSIDRQNDLAHAV